MHRGGGVGEGGVGWGVWIMRNGGHNLRKNLRENQSIDFLMKSVFFFWGEILEREIALSIWGGGKDIEDEDEKRGVTSTFYYNKKKNSRQSLCFWDIFLFLYPIFILWFHILIFFVFVVVVTLSLLSFYISKFLSKRERKDGFKWLWRNEFILV